MPQPTRWLPLPKIGIVPRKSAENPADPAQILLQVLGIPHETASPRPEGRHGAEILSLSAQQCGRE